MSTLLAIAFDGAGYRTLARFNSNANRIKAKDYWLNIHDLAKIFRSICQLYAQPANRSRIGDEIVNASKSIASDDIVEKLSSGRCFLSFLYESFPVVHTCVQQAPMSAGLHRINWQSERREDQYLRPGLQVAVLDVTDPMNARLFLGEVTTDNIVMAESRSSPEHPMHQWAGISDEDLERWRTKMDIPNKFQNVEAVHVAETPGPTTSLFQIAAQSLWNARRSHSIEQLPVVVRERCLSEMARDTSGLGIQLSDDFGNNAQHLNALTNQLERVDLRGFKSLGPKLVVQVALTSGLSWRSLDLSQQRGLRLVHIRAILGYAPALRTLYLGEDESSISHQDLLNLLHTAPDMCRIDHPLLYQFHFEERSCSAHYPRTIFSQVIVTTIEGDAFKHLVGSMCGDYLTLHEWGQVIRRLQHKFQQSPASSLYEALETVTHLIAVQDDNIIRPVPRMLLQWTDPVRLLDFPVVNDYHESWSLLLLLKRDGHPTFDYSCAKFAVSAHDRRKRRKTCASEKPTPLDVITGDLEEVAHELNHDYTEKISGPVISRHQWSVNEVEAIFRSIAKRIGSSLRY